MLHRVYAWLVNAKIYHPHCIRVVQQRYAWAYQELADEACDEEGHLCDVFHCRVIGSCSPVNPVHCNHIYLTYVQYCMDKPFNPGRFCTQRSVIRNKYVRCFLKKGMWQNIVHWCCFIFLRVDCQTAAEKLFWCQMHIPGMSLLQCSNKHCPEWVDSERNQPRRTSVELGLRPWSCCGVPVSHRAHLEWVNWPGTPGPVLLPTRRKSWSNHTVYHCCTEKMSLCTTHFPYYHLG